jgi:hypothetical protein
MMEGDYRALLWRLVSDQLFLSESEFYEWLHGWEVSCIERADALVAIRLRKGPEFHFVMTGSTRSVTRADINSCIQPIIDEHGYATTKTPKDDARQQRFNELLGFVKTGEDEFDIHYRIEAMRHIRR